VPGNHANLLVRFALDVLYARVQVANAGPMRLRPSDWMSFDCRTRVLFVRAAFIVFAFKLSVFRMLAAAGLALGRF
jgi:chromate transporter